MGQPPEPPKTFTNNNVYVPGPKFMVMKRISESDETLQNVSPFLIKKMIDYTCDGVVDQCTKISNGSVLIKTKNQKQTEKLSKLTALSNAIAVVVTEHNYLNHCKGVIYSNELRSIAEEEILRELESQAICEIKKIKKMVGKELVETGLLIISFATHTLPEYISIGYERVKVRPYIPYPLRCNTCFKFGHTKRVCKGEKTCRKCGQKQHTDDDDMQSCTNEINCVNCTARKYSNSNHLTLDKKCPIFVEKQEITAIKILQKVDIKTAYSIYNLRHPQQQSTYASKTSQNTTTSPAVTNVQRDDAITKTLHSSLKQQTTTTNSNSNITATTNTNRDLVSYSDVEANADGLPTTSTTAVKSLNSKYNKNISILPKNISKRKLSQIKSKSKLSNTKTNTLINHKMQEKCKDLDYDQPMSDT